MVSPRRKIMHTKAGVIGFCFYGDEICVEVGNGFKFMPWGKIVL